MNTIEFPFPLPKDFLKFPPSNYPCWVSLYIRGDRVEHVVIGLATPELNHKEQKRSK